MGARKVVIKKGLKRLNLTKTRLLIELDGLSGWFKEKKYLRTADWISFIRKMIDEEEVTDYMKDLNEVLIQYELEVGRDGDHRKECFAIIRLIYGHALEKGADGFRMLLSDLTPQMQDFVNAYRKLATMSSVINDLNLDEEVRYTTACYTYQNTVEGAYWSFLKILNAFRNYSSICPIPFEDLEKMKPWEIKKSLINQFPSSCVLFKNWFDGGLRNAIAHPDFNYDAKTKKMVFLHIHRGIIKFDEQYTFDEFMEIFHELHAVTEICFEFILLIRLRDICSTFDRARAP